jgi:hypothetical protein
MSGFEVWLYLVLIPNLVLPLAGLIVCSGVGVVVASVFTYVLWLDTLPEETVDRIKLTNDFVFTEHERSIRGIDKSLKILKRCGAVFFITLLLSTGVPDKKEIAAIVLIPYASNNSEFKKIPENLAKKLNDFLTDKLEQETKSE